VTTLRDASGTPNPPLASADPPPNQLPLGRIWGESTA
jgi:hypothetical protein